MGSNRIHRTAGKAGRVIALVWLVLAAASMQLAATVEGVMARRVASEAAGEQVAPQTRDTRLASAGPTIRAVPPSDLRFLADRSDQGPGAGGPGPALPASLWHGVETPVARSSGPTGQDIIAALVPAHYFRVRAPPAALAGQITIATPVLTGTVA